MPSRLNPGEDLSAVGGLASDDGESRLVLQGDGNVVLYRSNGVARWASGTDSAVVAVMQGDGNFVLYAAGGRPVWDSGTWGNDGSFLVLQDDGNLVVYRPDGTPLWASNTVIVRGGVPRFLPSTHGFAFSNSTFPAVPDLKIPVGAAVIGIGDASNGLCGGMAFAVRDYVEAGMPIPAQTTNPSSGPLFDYIVRRLFDSFNLALPPPPPPAPPFPGTFFTPIPPFGPGPATYLHLMNPSLPDHETTVSQIGLAWHGRAWTMIVDSWPAIRSDLDHGVLSPVGLVEVKSADPGQLGMNHQVLAYGYALDGTDLMIRVYDPNHPRDDHVTMSLNIGDPNHTTPVTYSAGATVWCFFRPLYIVAFPPPVP